MRSVKGSVNRSVKEFVKEPVKESVKESAKESVKKAVKESAKESEIDWDLNVGLDPDLNLGLDLYRYLYNRNSSTYRSILIHTLHATRTNKTNATLASHFNVAQRPHLGNAPPHDAELRLCIPSVLQQHKHHTTLKSHHGVEFRRSTA